MSKTAAAVRPRSSYHQARRRRDRLAFILLAGPALIWFGALMVWPLIDMFRVSTLKWNGFLEQGEFIGLGNYVRLLSADPRFRQALLNTGKQLLIGLPLGLPLSYMLGFFLSLRQPGYRLFRVIFFTPAIISVAGTSLMFIGIYMPDGILNSTLRAIGLGAFATNWLGDPATAMWAVIATDIWGSVGYQSILLFAALSGVPQELYEAARIDGAGYWTIMWRIAFPLILDFFGVSLMLRTIWILLGSAQTVLVLTKGGPGDQSLTVGYYLYSSAFDSQRLGFSQAIAVLTFCTGLIIVFFIRRATRRSYAV